MSQGASSNSSLLPLLSYQPFKHSSYIPEPMMRRCWMLCPESPAQLPGGRPSIAGTSHERQRHFAWLNSLRRVLGPWAGEALCGASDGKRWGLSTELGRGCHTATVMGAC